MRTNKAISLVMAASLLMMVGCSDAKETTSTTSTNTASQPSDVKEAEKTAAIEKNTAGNTAGTGSSTQPTNTQGTTQNVAPAQTSKQPVVDFAYVKAQVKVGMTREQVIKLLGDQYTEVVSSTDGRKILRFDITGNKEYKYTFKDFERIDKEGILNGSMLLQVFVTMSDKDTVATYAAFKKADNGNVFEYRVFENGTERESTHA